MYIPRKSWVYPESENMQALASAIMNAKYPELLISGPRNCSKSFTTLQCELSLIEMHAGIQILNLRHEMTAMGALFSQLDRHILKYGLNDKRNPFTFHSSTKSEPRTHLLFDNGSKMLFAGMDKPNKALGDAVDLVFYNEVQLEHNPTHWSAVLGCIEGGRGGGWNGKSLAIADMNPTHKKFWGYLRAHPDDPSASPAMHHFWVHHKDHPHFYSWQHEKWTHKGQSTVDGLKRAYQPEESYDYQRNVEGKFCAAEGLVYPQFKIDRHVKEVVRDEIPDSAIWRLSADHGKIASVGVYAETPEKHIRFKEVYRQGLSPNVVIEKIQAIQKQYHIPEIEYVVADHEHSARSIFEEAGFEVKIADKTVSVKDGIDIVRSAFINDRVLINKDSLFDPDPELEIKCLTDELLALAYKPAEKQTGSKADDLPDPQCADHAADEFRYYCVDTMSAQPFDLPAVLGTVKIYDL